MALEKVSAGWVLVTLLGLVLVVQSRAALGSVDDHSTGTLYHRVCRCGHADQQTHFSFRAAPVQYHL